MSRTPDRQYGPSLEEAIEFEDQGTDPVIVGRLQRNGSGLMYKKDGGAPIDLTVGGSGLSEAQHRTLKQLIHFIDSGPAEGFASGAYREILPSAGPFPTSEIWWTSAAKTHKIVELTITRNANQTPDTEEWEIYDSDGTTVLATVTDAISYSGIFETSRTRTIA